MAEHRSGTPMIVLGGGPSQEIFLQDIYARYGDFTLLDVNRDAPGRQWAERFFHASIYEFGACRDALAAFVTPDSRVMTFATGPAGEVCYRLCRAFELPRRSGTLAAAANNKKFLADILDQNGLRVPRQIVSNETGFDPALLESMTFPAVLKPIQAGGGQGVRILEGRDEAIGLCRQLRRPFLLQEKLSGREELLWLIVRQGRIVALLHGQNLFDESTGWHSPLGLAIERIPLQHGIPLRWTKLASQLIDVFNLRDDSIVAELIADDRGDTIIDVELNGLSAFACSKVLEGNLLTSLLVDTYLQRDFSGPKTAGWVSCMAFFAAPEPAALTQMARKATRIGSCVVEPPRNVSKLVCFDTTVYKGGYLIITDAVDLTEAAAKARAILVEAAA